MLVQHVIAFVCSWYTVLPGEETDVTCERDLAQTGSGLCLSVVSHGQHLRQLAMHAAGVGDLHVQGNCPKPSLLPKLHPRISPSQHMASQGDLHGTNHKFAKAPHTCCRRQVKAVF
jgi:hypothetical protein